MTVIRARRTASCRIGYRSTFSLWPVHDSLSKHSSGEMHLLAMFRCRPFPKTLRAPFSDGVPKG
jgi:hypothetical protein